MKYSTYLIIVAQKITKNKHHPMYQPLRMRRDYGGDDLEKEQQRRLERLRKLGLIANDLEEDTPQF